MLCGVVENGTGKNAKISGIRIAGQNRNFSAVGRE